MSTTKKTVLVTGSSRGIGKAIAYAFGKAGYHVALNGSKEEQTLENTKEEFLEKGIACQSFFYDVSSYENTKKLFSAVNAQFGEIDILVNNAGISHMGLFTDMEEPQWQHLLAVNLHSVLNCTHLALPSMVRNKEGVIINISSMWGERGASCEAIYSASKGAINAFTKAMAKEVGPSEVRVNAIACGVIDTQMNHWLSSQERQQLEDEISLMRFGTPEEVGELAVFLASEKSSFLTGQVITLDGGMV